MSVNGGRTGYLHVSADYGNSRIEGSDSAENAYAALYETPLRYLFGAKEGTSEGTPADTDREACRAKCKGLPTTAYYACATRCGFTVRELTRSPQELLEWLQGLPLALLGVVIIGIGAYALVKD